jgi:hypothetical protein
MKKYFLPKIDQLDKLNRGELFEFAINKKLDSTYVYVKDSTNHKTDSDIPALNASVKLVNGCTLCKCEKDLDSAIDNYLTSDFSSLYIVGFDMLNNADYGVIEMNKLEMANFLKSYAQLDRQSDRKGGATTLRLRLTSYSKQQWIWNELGR